MAKEAALPRGYVNDHQMRLYMKYDQTEGPSAVSLHAGFCVEGLSA
jgi:hypothetical protein